jgi:hypothetical protein
MDDTPDHVKKIQLDIWLAKPFEERLRLTLQMQDELFTFWREVKKSMVENYPDKKSEPGEKS